MEKYGLYLRGNIDDADDEPVDGNSPVNHSISGRLIAKPGMDYDQ